MCQGRVSKLLNTKAARRARLGFCAAFVSANKGGGNAKHFPRLYKSVFTQNYCTPFCVYFPHNFVVRLVNTQSIDIRRPPCYAKKSAANSHKNFV
jgi:hypothetical protein